MELDYNKTVHRTYKRKLYPTDSQHQDLMRMWQACKFTYNLCLEQRMRATRQGIIPSLVELAEYQDARMKAYDVGEGDKWQHPLGEIPDRIPKDDKGKVTPLAKLSKYDQSKFIKGLRIARGWDGKLPAKALYQVVDDVDANMKSFYGLVKRYRNGLGDPPKPPHYKSRRSPISIGFANHGGVKIIDKYHVKVQGVGTIHAKLDGIPDGISEYQSTSYIEITRDTAGQWWLHIMFKNVPLSRLLPVLEVDGAVGVDLGIVHLLTTSDGEHIANVRPLELQLEKIQKTDKAISRILKTYLRRNGLEYNKHNVKRHYRTALDSIKGRKLRTQKNRQLRKAARTRKTIIQQAVAKLVYRYDTIALEDLNVKGLGRGKLARAAKDVGWGLFYSELKRKANELNTLLLFVNPAYTSQACNKCGYTAKSNRLTQSVFKCGKCGHEENADVNGAKNILARAIEDASNGVAKTERTTGKRKKRVQDTKGELSTAKDLTEVLAI